MRLRIVRALLDDENNVSQLIGSLSARQPNLLDHQAVLYRSGLLSCSQFTGVPLKLLLDQCGVDYKKKALRAGRGHPRLVDDPHRADGADRAR